MRIDEDCIGTKEIPDDALYGVHAARAAENFQISSEKLHPLLIQSLIQIKRAAAQTNLAAGALPENKAKAIINACNELLFGSYNAEFIVPAIQGGAGTSANMNVNEVISNLATRNSGVKIHPNDDVNLAQSTNDTFPTAGKMAMLRSIPSLMASLNRLTKTLLDLAGEYQDTIKVGRTQLQDAVPTTFGKTFHGYYSMFRRDIKRIEMASNSLKEVNLGGTAIGTGINATPYYQDNVVRTLEGTAKLGLKQAEDLIDCTQNCDAYVIFSGALKALAVDMSKFSNDLRLLSSGPQAGLAELILPAKQAGSSIMPGKINPVIPEVVNQVSFEVIGDDVTVTMAAESGQMELNAFEPIIFKNILKDEEFLTNALTTLNDNCVSDIMVNEAACAKEVEYSAVTATILTPYLGYVKTTEIVKQATRENKSVKELVKDSGLLNASLVDELFKADSLVNERIAVKAMAK